jgi:hypothetical protein
VRGGAGDTPKWGHGFAVVESVPPHSAYTVRAIVTLRVPWSMRSCRLTYSVSAASRGRSTARGALGTLVHVALQLQALVRLRHIVSERIRSRCMPKETTGTGITIHSP